MPSVKILTAAIVLALVPLVTAATDRWLVKTIVGYRL
jgi:hypothetical protein